MLPECPEDGNCYGCGDPIDKCMATEIDGHYYCDGCLEAQIDEDYEEAEDGSPDNPQK